MVFQCTKSILNSMQDIMKTSEKILHYIALVTGICSLSLLTIYLGLVTYYSLI